MSPYLKSPLETSLVKLWYGQRAWPSYLLLPLSGLFCVISALRRWLHKRQQLPHAVPIIIVGNITVGGTGKTPLVIWLVEKLRQAGLKPGVISRGFGSQGKTGLVQVHDHPNAVGDEPLLIVQRTGVPLYVNPKRNQAVASLLAEQACNVIIADDGLQHYRLKRDLEICVIDGQRWFGNGWCLPAGPLREPVSRLLKCDFTVINGQTLQLQAQHLINLKTGEQQALALWQGRTVYAVTGIGNPQRFSVTLQQAGLKPRLRAYPDHHAFSAQDLIMAEDLPILMTEKDAVKCRPFATSACWYLPISAQIEPYLAAAILQRIQGLLHGQEVVRNTGLPGD